VRRAGLAERLAEVVLDHQLFGGDHGGRWRVLPGGQFALPAQQRHVIARRVAGDVLRLLDPLLDALAGCGWRYQRPADAGVQRRRDQPAHHGHGRIGPYHPPARADEPILQRGARRLSGGPKQFPPRDPAAPVRVVALRVDLAGRHREDQRRGGERLGVHDAGGTGGSGDLVQGRGGAR
jgi:hypothetical protein